MTHIKEDLMSKISDADYSKSNAPAIKRAVELINQNREKRRLLLKSFPGILLLGDWHGIGINLAFQNRIKQKFISEFYHAFTLDDIKLEFPEADDIEIRKNGIDLAACILLIDGSGTGTAAETIAICNRLNWNAKCICFAEKGKNFSELFKERPHLKLFKNPIIDYNSLEELGQKMLFHGKKMADDWIEEKLKENNKTKTIK